jgi:hypothetical protein
LWKYQAIFEQNTLFTYFFSGALAGSAGWAASGFASSAFFSGSGAFAGSAGLAGSAAGLAGSSFLAQPAATIIDVANNRATNKAINLRILISPPYLPKFSDFLNHREHGEKIFLCGE